MTESLVIVFRMRTGFRTIECAGDALGCRPDEVWIFGQPRTPGEHVVWRATEPVVAVTPRELVHCIPFEPAVAVRGFGGRNIQIFEEAERQ